MIIPCILLSTLIYIVYEINMHTVTPSKEVLSKAWINSFSQFSSLKKTESRHAIASHHSFYFLTIKIFLNYNHIIPVREILNCVIHTIFSAMNDVLNGHSSCPNSIIGVSMISRVVLVASQIVVLLVVFSGSLKKIKVWLKNYLECFSFKNHDHFTI